VHVRHVLYPEGGPVMLLHAFNECMLPFSKISISFINKPGC
jgi:hypothetical protein